VTARPGALLAVAGLAALAVVSGVGSGGAPRTAVVTRGDLVLSVDVEGELSAVRSTAISPPASVEAEFKIAFMAPEGSSVKKGDAILGFDTEALQRQLVEREAEYAAAVKKVEQKELELTLKLLDIRVQAAQADADLGKANLKVEVPADVQMRLELEKARLDQKGRERDLENLTAERASAQVLNDAELRSLRSQRDRARGRVSELKGAIERMSVKAPQDGIVVYQTDWDDEKKKVGDSVWMAEQILSLPDLSEMRADGIVDEADGGSLKDGQKVVLRLEARPDLDLPGRVAKVGRTVRPRSRRSPGKVFKVDIALARTDPTLMRPAMRFRGEIETDRLGGLLLLPRDAVQLRPSGPVVLVRRLFGWRETPVTLGRGNRAQVEVLRGVSAGDVVSLVGPVEPPAGGPPTSGGRS
jgi:HlyD family secretion protein